MRKLLLSILLLAVSSAFAQSGFYLKDSDRVVFYGDSITDQRLYSTFAESYVVTRFPKLDVTFTHSGWGGDRVGGGGGGPVDLRLARDVFAYKPTVVTIMLGMNDGSYRAFDQEIFERYANGYTHIVEALRQNAPGVRITAIIPSPFDDVTRDPKFPGGYNAVLVRYGDFLKEQSAKQKFDVADMNAPVVAALVKAKALDAEGSAKISPDRVHPAPSGHLLMAAALLKAWHAPAVVSEVELNAAEKKAGRAENATVTEIGNAGGLTWTQADNSLPLPLDLKDPVLPLALKASDLLDTLDREMLTVTNLTAERYVLSIDGEKIGAFSKEQLGQGINLATLPTPMLKQAQDVHALTLKRSLIHNTRWRTIQVPMAEDDLPNKQGAMDALDKLDNDLRAKQHAAAQPKPHKYELKPE